MMESENAIEVASAEEYPMYGVYRDEQLENEGFVENEISQLWELHKCCSGEIKTEQFRQRSIGNSLGELLHRMKAILASPGKMGKWSGWLRAMRIPRASADRWVQRYVEAFHLSSEAPRGSVHEASEAEIGKLFAFVWPRCEKVLTTEWARYQFVRCLLFRSGLVYDFNERGILLYEPGFEPQEPEVIASEPHTVTGDDEDVL
jgi:hypothetical protein